MTLDARMARVWVDPDQIQQVFFNVIKNAEQAMIDANGGGKLTVVTRGTAEAACASRSPTTAPASRPTSSAASSTRSSRPRTPARAPASA